MKRSLLALAALALMLGGARHAQADLITFSPGFAFSTTPVTYQGVTFASIPNGSSGGAGLQANTDWSPFFQNIPGASLGKALNDSQGQTDVTMTFTNSVSDVSILLSTNPVTTWTVTAFDINSNPLGSTTVTMAGQAMAVQATLALSNIHSIEITEPSDNGNITLFDDLSFQPAASPTPEPSTVALLGIGAVCSLGYRWRRRRQSA